MCRPIKSDCNEAKTFPIVSAAEAISDDPMGVPASYLSENWTPPSPRSCATSDKVPDLLVDLRNVTGVLSGSTDKTRG